jgi:hypothetical protein
MTMDADPEPEALAAHTDTVRVLASGNAVV